MKERELEWLVYRQRVDIENHRFWVGPSTWSSLTAHEFLGKTEHRIRRAG